MGKKFLFNPIEGTFDIVAGEEENCLLTLSAQQNAINANTVIELRDDVAGIGVNNNIVFNNGTHRATLKAGKTYKLQAYIRHLGSASNTAGGYKWYDVTNTTFIGVENQVQSMNSLGNDGNQPSNGVIITPTTNIEVELRCQGVSVANQSISFGSTYAIIEKISESVYNVATMGFNDQTGSKYFDIGTMRIQWGRVSSTMDGDQTVTFPVAFASAPVVTTSMERDSNAGYGAVDSVTATNFVFNRVDTIDNADNPFIIYIALGLKP